MKYLIKYILIAIFISGIFFILSLGRHSIVKHTLFSSFQFYNYSSEITADKNNILMWETNGKKSGQLTWKDGKKYCENLILSGYDNWRLPSDKELIQLGKTINYLYFDGYYDWYWTNTIGGKVSFALRVSGSYDITKPNNYKYVRCVRDFNKK